MEELTAGQIAELRSALESASQQLNEQLASNKGASDAVALDQTLVGRVSRIDAMQQQQMAVSTRKQAELQLQRVRLALAACDSGDYGFCKRCDEAIGYPRLRARPETPLCISCQNLRDSQQ